MKHEPARLEDITEEAFADYERVRKSGVTNMYSRSVLDLAGIDEETHRGIIKHYGELCAKWPHIRDLDQ